MSRKPSRTKISVLHQLCNLIPGGVVNRLASEYGVDRKARRFSPWSHVVALLYTQFTHATSLNDVCDALQNHAGKLSRIRQAKAPTRNTLSHANRQRDGRMAQALFWEVFDHLTSSHLGFAKPNHASVPRRFKRAISIIDTSTIALVVHSIDWAKHRRRKAAAKLHLNLDLRSMLPNYVRVGSAGEADNTKARELCADLQDGEIVVFDRAYVDFGHLYDLDQRGVSWVTRAKYNQGYKVVQPHSQPSGIILQDDLIVMKEYLTRTKYPQGLRLIRARVQVKNESTELVFLTNNLQWAPTSIADLYKSRWQIEVFFKQLKQTLQLYDFLGYNENAVLWQIWTALLLYILLRFLAYIHTWNHTFKRFFCLLRACVWEGFQIASLVHNCGTARGSIRIRGTPHQAYLPGFNDFVL